MGIFKLMMAMVALLAVTTLATANGNDTFHQKLDQLLQGQAEIKGDTSQIKEILGHVYQGTVPRGGTLTKLCDENGWSLPVLMGHNSIEDANTVAAGTTFTYPQTPEEFNTALRKGKVLYRNWLNNQDVTFRVKRMKVDEARIDELNVKVAAFTERLQIKNMEIDQLKIRLAEITERLKIKREEIEDLEIQNANIQNANINNLEVQRATIENMYIGKLKIKQLEIDELNGCLMAARKRIGELESRTSHDTVITDAPATLSEANLAEPCFACPGNGSIQVTSCSKIETDIESFPGEKVNLLVCEPKHNPVGSIASGWWYRGKGEGWVLQVVRYLDFMNPDGWGKWPNENHASWRHLKAIVSQKPTAPGKMWQNCNRQLFRGDKS